MTPTFRILLTFLVLLLVAGCSQQPKLISTAWDKDSDRIADYYERWAGVPYRLGGSSAAGIDCSAFVQNLYRAVYDKNLPRTTEDQAALGYQVLASELQPGDLVFFKTGWKLRHVGVYLGRGQFVHASTSRGVTRSELTNPYWQNAYWKSKRLN